MDNNNSKIKNKTNKISNDETNYVSLDKFNSDQSGLINKTDLINFIKHSIYIEMLSGKLELVYNLENPEEVEFVDLKAHISCRKKLDNMKKVNMLDLIYKKLLEHDEKFVEMDNRLTTIESDIAKIKNCPTIQKEIEK